MCLSAMLIVLFTLSGCVDSLLRERADLRALPTIQPSDTIRTGDYRSPEDIPVTLYLPDWNRDRLVTAADTVTVYAGADITEAVAIRLLDRLGQMFPSLKGSQLSLMSGTGSVERSGGIVFVNLNSTMWLLEPSEKSVARMALTYTLTELPGVNYVGILVNGRDDAIDAGGSVPYGLHKRSISEDIETYLNGLETSLAAETNGLTRDVALYFASTDGLRILPETRGVTIPSGPRDELRERLVKVLLTELSKGSLIRQTQTRSLLNPDYMVGEPRIVTPTGSADTLLQLSFRSELYDYLTINGGTPYLFFASLTETLTGFVPGLDGLIAQVGGETVTEIRAPDDRTLHLRNGRMTRADFAGSVADLGLLYFPREDGTGLTAIERAIEQNLADDPRTLLKLLLAGPRRYDPDAKLLPALPASDGTPSAFADADLLGVSIESGEALVNLSEDIASACAELTAAQARGFIFSVVNTLTGLRGVNKVRFFVEGQARDLFYQSESGSAADARPADLSGGMDAGVSSLGEFYRQPGLIVTEFGNIDEVDAPETATPADAVPDGTDAHDAAVIDEV
ncbi:hypothetical protein AGMMS49992_00170 [Clostridia bacterium]|nr:hypothetical protein AGMMS49992_00170 [Clostridia bacterium]